jgi:hypothetical protein
MKKIFLIVIVVAVIFVGYKLFSKPVSTEKPMVTEVETMLTDFLLTRNRSKCSGEVSLGYLRNVEIGDYDATLMGGNEGGFPIYAYYEVLCNGKVISKDLNEDQQKVAITALRVRSGKAEFFEPKVLTDFGKMLERSF